MTALMREARVAGALLLRGLLWLALGTCSAGVLFHLFLRYGGT